MPTTQTYQTIVMHAVADEVKVSAQPSTGSAILAIGYNGIHGAVTIFAEPLIGKGDDTLGGLMQLEDIGCAIAQQARALANERLAQLAKQADLARAARKEAAADRADEHDEIGRVA